MSGPFFRIPLPFFLPNFNPFFFLKLLFYLFLVFSTFGYYFRKTSVVERLGRQMEPFPNKRSWTNVSVLIVVERLGRHPKRDQMLQNRACLSPYCGGEVGSTGINYEVRNI